MVSATKRTDSKPLTKIFKIENITYIISVDDCFAESYVDKLRNKLMVDSLMAPDKVIKFLDKLGKDINDINQMIELGENAQSEILELIKCLNNTEFQMYDGFDPLSKSSINLKSDKDEIIYFLNGLKDDGIIEGYKTFSSTHDAEKFYNNERETITSGSALWLIDRNFENVGESANAGLDFAKNIIEKKRRK